MVEFTVKEVKVYKARISLNCMESWADNGMIVDKVRLAGVIDVTVSRSGYYRTCQAMWVGPDTTAMLPTQITEIVEI